MKMIYTLKEIQTAKNGDWLSGGGECCGFDAFVDEDKVVCEDRACGRPVAWTGTFSLALLKKVAAGVNVADLRFDEWGEAVVPVTSDIQLVIDKTEDIFNLRRSTREDVE